MVHFVLNGGTFFEILILYMKKGLFQRKKDLFMVVLHNKL